MTFTRDIAISTSMVGMSQCTGESHYSRFRP